MTAIAVQLALLAALLAGPAGALDDAARESILAGAQDAYQRGLSLRRNDPDAADRAFREAIAGFDRLVDDGVVNGPLLYNLGNAYLQRGDVGRAILQYRRAEAMMPGDPLLGHNLEYARSLRRDQIPPSGERALAAALLGWHARFSTGARFTAFAVLYAAAFAVMALSLFRRPAAWRWTAAALIVAAAVPGASVAVDLRGAGPRDAVIVTNDVVVRKGNSEGFEPQFREPVHEGLEVRLLDERGGWLYIELPNAKTGWIRADQAEVV